MSVTWENLVPASPPAGDPPRPVFKRPILSGETRSEAQIIEQYLLECTLADRLLAASPADRPWVYGEVYDELFRRLPHHPQHTRKARDPSMRKEIERQVMFLQPHLGPDKQFIEIGAGDGALSLRVAPHCASVVVIDVSEVIAERSQWPASCRFALSHGTDIPVPDGSVDVAYSNQLMEHLHPDDAQAQLRDIYRSLKRGGCYVCVTPNRAAGPWDISVYFNEVARGFHLREYSVGDLTSMFRQVGFGRIDVYAGGRGFFFRVPAALVRVAEAALQALPYRPRSKLSRWMPVRGLVGLRVVAYK